MRKAPIHWTAASSANEGNQYYDYYNIISIKQMNNY